MDWVGVGNGKRTETTPTWRRDGDKDVGQRRKTRKRNGKSSGDIEMGGGKY
jgi:hypothetical protein